MPESFADLAAQGHLTKAQFVALVRQAVLEHGSQTKLAKAAGTTQDRLSGFISDHGLHDSFPALSHYLRYSHIGLWRSVNTGLLYTSEEVYTAFMEHVIQTGTMVNLAGRLGIGAETARKTKRRKIIGPATAAKMGFVKEHLWRKSEK